jgi:hypothetical protein
MKISVDEWFDYLDGCASAETRTLVDLAVSTDEPSRSVFNALCWSDAELRAEARRLNASMVLQQPDVSRACTAVLGRVTLAPSFTPDRLARVEALLTPWCGRRVAAGLVLAAVARTSGQPAGRLWPSFVENAAVLTAGLCGVSASRLIIEFGRTAM